METPWYFFHRLKSFTSYDSIIFHSTGEQKIQKGMLTLLYFSFWELFAKCEKKKNQFLTAANYVPYEGFFHNN